MGLESVPERRQTSNEFMFSLSSCVFTIVVPSNLKKCHSAPHDCPTFLTADDQKHFISSIIDLRFMSSHVNHYRKRQVAQANERSCAICYRPTDTVLMSTDSKDWFYCCPAHLKDPGMATPVVDQAAEKARLMQLEVAKIKAEHDQKEKRKELAKEEKEKEKTSASSSWLSNPFSSFNNSSKETKAKPGPEPTMVPPTPEPKEFSLHRTLYQHRINLKQQAAQQKARDAQWSTLQFPTAPTK